MNPWGLLVFLLWTAPAQAKLCNPMKEKCWLYGKNGSTSPAYPSKSSGFKVNPSAVPLEKGWGGETIYFDSSFDFALVRGTGRIGAAISPSNGEESFFGPPGLELDSEFLERKQNGTKYDSQNVALAGAFQLLSNRKSGLQRFELNLGVIGKYNKLSKDVWPGLGISGIGGPFTFGYSVSEDQYVVDFSSIGLAEELKFKYKTATISGGIFLNNLAVDYSHLRVTIQEHEAISIYLLTGSILLQRWIFTAASRREVSDRPAYDYKLKTLKVEEEKNELFGGIQFSPTRVLMVGVFYNYYLLREMSAGATLFF